VTAEQVPPAAGPGLGLGGPGLAANLEHARAELRRIIARYPQPRSALLPMLHLVQSYDGYVTPAGIELCAAELELTEAEVAAVATFYTMYKRHPVGDYHVGVCTNTLCAVMGGDAIWASLSAHLGIGHDETTDDGRVSLERVECNAACDYAPVVMVNWEFFDNQTPQSAVDTVDRLRAGEAVHASRGPRVCTFREAERVLAGFPDGLATQGPSAGEASLRGLRLVRAAETDEAAGERAGAGAGRPGGDQGTAAATAAVGSAATDVRRQQQQRSGTAVPQQTAQSDPAHPAEPGHDDTRSPSAEETP
jgi:NADH-quinone oxidoreductase subunit E